MLNENNIKYFAVDGEDKELASMLKQKSSSVCEIQPEMLDKHFYAYNAIGSSSLGTLSDEPQFIISPYQQNGERKEDWDQDKSMSKEEMIESKNWAVKATMAHVSHYWTDASGNRQASYSYVMLMFVSPNAKRIIVNYHKGDHIMVEGSLETMNYANPQDQASKVHVNYIRVSSFLCNGGRSIRRTALKKLLGKRDADPSERIKQIMAKINDPSTSREQIVILANQLAEEKKKLLTVKRDERDVSSMSGSSQGGRQDERKRVNRSRISGEQRKATRQGVSKSEKPAGGRSEAVRAFAGDSGRAMASNGAGGRQSRRMPVRGRHASENARPEEEKKSHVSSMQLLNRVKSMYGRAKEEAEVKAAEAEAKDQSERIDDLDPRYSSYFDQMVARMRKAYEENPEKYLEEERLEARHMEESCGRDKTVIRDPEVSDLEDCNFSGEDPESKSGFATKEF